MKFINCSFYLAVSSLIILEMSASNGKTRGLLKYLKKKSKLYQVMFITDEQMLLNSSSSHNFLITDVSKHFPTLSITLSKLHFDFKKYRSIALQPSRRTTLFIIILNGNDNNTWRQVSEVLLQLRKLSQTHSYPRCLINFLSQTKSPTTKINMEFLWLQDFLDISILEHLQKNRKSLSPGAVEFVLHEINQFSKTYSAREITAQTKWFPDKLVNVYGYKIDFLVSTLNDGLGMVQYKRLFEFARLLIKSMHGLAKIVTVPTGSYSQLLNILYKQKTEMLLNIVRQPIYNDYLNYPKIRVLVFSNVKAIVPKIARTSKVYVISQEFIYMTVATAVAVGGIRVTAFIMKFNKSCWQTFNIGKIFMGMSIIKEPEKLSERIVFGTLILSCIVYSGYIYSVILEIGLRAVPQISSLQQLAESSLTPMLRYLERISLSASSVSYIQKLGNKSLELADENTDFDCLKYLEKYKNVTCVSGVAEEVVNNFLAKKRELKVLILQEPLIYFIETYLARRGSPYIDRFNQAILRAFDSGLLAKILYSGAKISKKVSPPEEIGKEKLLLIVCYVLTIGYVLAMIIFIAEMVSIVVWHKLGKRN